MNRRASQTSDQNKLPDNRRSRMAETARGLAPTRANFSRVARDEISMGWVYLLAMGLLLGLFTYQAYLFFVWGAGNGWGLRYLLLPAVFGLAALWVAARYVQDVFELPGVMSALQHLVAARFSVWLPSLEIKDGKRSLNKDELNLLADVGGPGSLVVRPGDAVVLESSYYPIRVEGPGRYYVRQFEMVKDVVRLAEQEDRIASLTVLSGDGINLAIRDVRFRYQLTNRSQTSGGSGDSRAKAVINRVYNRPVEEEGMIPWPDQVCQLVEQTLREYSGSRPADDLLVASSSHYDPYKMVTDRFSSDEVQERFAAIGAEIVWVTLSHFETIAQTKPAPKKESSAPRASGNTVIDRSFTDRQREVYQQMGRAEALAEIVIRVVHGLDGLPLEDQDLVVVQQALVAQARQAIMAQQNG